MPPSGGIKKLKSVTSLKGRINVIYVGSTCNPETRYNSAQTATMFVTRSRNMVCDEQKLLDWFGSELHRDKTWRGNGLQNDHEKAGNQGRGWVYVLVMPDEDGSTIRRQQQRRASPRDSSVRPQREVETEVAEDLSDADLQEMQGLRQATANSLHQLSRDDLAKLVSQLYENVDEAQSYIDHAVLGL